jgi:broad specificity phosphatase PhoE
MPNLTRIILIRHGAVHNPQKIFYGRLPRFKLSDKGLEEARSAALILKNTSLSALFSSPLLRTRQTAREILRYHPTLRPRLSSLITEVRIPFEGLPQSHIKALSGTVYDTDTEKGEQPAEVLERSLRFVKMVRKTYPGAQVAAVSHGDVIFFLSLWAHRLPVTAEQKRHASDLGAVHYPTTGSLTTLTFASDNLDEIPDVSYVHSRTAS